MDVVHLNQKQLAARWCISEATLERWRSEGIERTWRSAMGKLVDGDDGLPAEEVGSWAKEKHDYLCRYIDISRSTWAKWDVAPTSIQLALARGHRWLAMLESGEAKSLKEIATREGIDNSYVSRMVNLAKLAPDIVAAILDDALPNHITLFDLAVDPPALWDEQRARLV